MSYKKSIVTMANVQRLEHPITHGLGGVSRRSCRIRYRERQLGRIKPLPLYPLDKCLKKAGLLK